MVNLTCYKQNLWNEHQTAEISLCWVRKSEFREDKIIKQQDMKSFFHTFPK